MLLLIYAWYIPGIPCSAHYIPIISYDIPILSHYIGNQLGLVANCLAKNIWSFQQFWSFWGRDHSSSYYLSSAIDFQRTSQRELAQLFCSKHGVIQSWIQKFVTLKKKTERDIPESIPIKFNCYSKYKNRKHKEVIKCVLCVRSKRRQVDIQNSSSFEAFAKNGWLI